MNKHQFIYNTIIKNGYQNRNVIHVLEIKNKNKKYKRYYHQAKILFDKINLLELEALSHLKKQDKILDVGAGAGRISIYLQEKGCNVTALEKSITICNILRKRGIKKVVKADVFKYFPKNKYDFVLFINTYSLFGKKEENIIYLFDFLKEKILNKDGKLIFILTEPRSKKTEIIKRRFIFKKEIGPWFESIYPSVKDVIKLAKESGLLIEKFKENNSNQYFLIFKTNHD